MAQDHTRKDLPRGWASMQHSLALSYRPKELPSSFSCFINSSIWEDRISLGNSFVALSSMARFRSWAARSPVTFPDASSFSMRAGSMSKMSSRGRKAFLKRNALLYASLRD